MTTITNFLESNFVDNAENRDLEVNQNPIWVLNVSNGTALNQSAIKEYIINHAVQTTKPLIHIDLGVSLIKKYPSVQFKNLQLENGLKICQPFKAKPYFIVRTPISLRAEPNFLTKLINQINKLYESQILKKLLNESSLAKKYNDKYCLLIEGIEAVLLLNKGKEVESFISQLSNLHQSIKQVSIFTQQKLMNQELMFSLERISTCLTTLTTWNSVEGVWECTSTVRRQTGYSNQELYTMTIQKPSQKIKVAKKLNIIDFNKETKEQKEMVKNLGFVVKKNEKDKEQTEQLKRMIYPHLKMRQTECECNKKDCQNPSCCQKQEENPDEGLIILDDQQEDEDDVDV